MNEVTKFGGGESGRPVTEMEAIDNNMRMDLEQSTTDYQMAWIKNLSKRVTTLEP